VFAYRVVADLFVFFAHFDIDLFDDAAAKVFGTLTESNRGQSQGFRAGAGAAVREVDG